MTTNFNHMYQLLILYSQTIRLYVKWSMVMGVVDACASCWWSIRERVQAGGSSPRRAGLPRARAARHEGARATARSADSAPGTGLRWEEQVL